MKDTQLKEVFEHSQGILEFNTESLHKSLIEFMTIFNEFSSCLLIIISKGVINSESFWLNKGINLSLMIQSLSFLIELVALIHYH